MKRITGNFSFDFITDSAISKDKLERKLAFGLNDAFSNVLHDLDIDVLDSEPTSLTLWILKISKRMIHCSIQQR